MRDLDQILIIRSFLLASSIPLLAGGAHAAPIENYDYGIVVTRSISDEIQPRMKLTEIETTHTVNDEFRDALIKSIGQTQSSLLRPAMMDPLNTLVNLQGVNVQAELAKTLTEFGARLRENFAKVAVTRETEFQLQIAPIQSPILKARNIGAKETPRLYYPSDRVTLVEVMPSAEEAYPDGQAYISTDIYRGITARLTDAYQAKPTDPYFVSMLIDVKIEPDVKASTVVAQAIIGLPIDKSMPFTQANDQITFKTIEFPGIKGDGLGFTAEDYPVAIVTFEQPLIGDAGKVLAEFGPLGAYKNGRWARAADPAAYKGLTPRLIGTPAMKAAGISLKDKVEVAFNVLNVAADVQTQTVTNLDLFLSVGASKLPGFKVGWINRADIDDQFKTEINKSIKQAIVDQESKLKQQGLDQAAKVGIPPDAVQAFLTQVFTITQPKRQVSK